MHAELYTLNWQEEASASYVIYWLITVLPYNSRLTSEELGYFKSSEERGDTGLARRATYHLTL